ncbi:MAG: hypothetical protein IB618_02440 [Candidatus Pacearchaeota archaeon]|nr:MAG: hypothetical protein IB618_02440 [Candidatus Pacearchaeota archaeon]
MDLEQIKRAQFAAREPDVPLFWQTLSTYAKGDYLMLAKPPLSEVYYLNSSGNIESEIGYNTFRKVENVKEIILKYSSFLDRLEDFSKRLKKENIRGIEDEEIKKLFYEIIEFLSEVMEIYKYTEAARFEKIEKHIYNFLDKKIEDKNKVKEILLKLISNEKTTGVMNEEKSNLLRVFGADDEIYNFVFAVSKLSYLRFKLKENLMKVVQEDIYPILQEIGTRFKITLEEMFITKIDEFEKILDGKTKPLEEIYKKRMKGYAFLQLNGKREVIEGTEFERLDEHIHNLTIKKEITEIKGQTAMKGKIIGKVRKIMDYEREMKNFIERFKKGDIIVTGMTQQT